MNRAEDLAELLLQGDFHVTPAQFMTMAQQCVDEDDMCADMKEAVDGMLDAIFESKVPEPVKCFAMGYIHLFEVNHHRGVSKRHVKTDATGNIRATTIRNEGEDGPAWYIWAPFWRAHTIFDKDTSEDQIDGYELCLNVIEKHCKLRRDDVERGLKFESGSSKRKKEK